MTDRQPIAERLAFAIELARAGGEATLRVFEQGRVSVQTKGDGTPVTVADKACETLIRGMLATRFPDDGVLGEEFGDSPGTTGYRWIIDPIDGTFSFMNGVPLFTTLLGVETLEGEEAGNAVAGVIHAPALNETVYGAIGQGAWHVVRGGPPRPARVSTTPALASATISTTSMDYWSDRDAPLWDRITKASAHTRGWPDAYGAILVATGRCDAIVEPRLHPWDIAPFGPILREAGGRSTDWSGRETVHASSSVASNGMIHDEVLALLRD